MIKPETARILVISPNETDCQNMKNFMARMPFNLMDSDFVVGKVVPVDDYDFAIFDAISLPRIMENTSLSDEQAAHIQLLKQYLGKPIKYIVYYGDFYFGLDKERCPSANSKFTLYARIKELIDFMNQYYKE